MYSSLGEGTTRRVAVIVDKYPCLSESFVRRELTCLQSFGFRLLVLTCSPALGSDQLLSPELQLTVVHSHEWARSPGLRIQVAKEMLRELPRSHSLFPSGLPGSRASVRAAWTAAALSHPLRNFRPHWVHSHFLGMPAAVACLLSERLQVPFSVSAHARDVFVPMVQVAKVCAQARFVTVCSQHAQTALIDQLPAGLENAIVHIPHDVECAPNLPKLREPAGPEFRLLSVCRLVPKKGLDTVLHALALLQSESPDRYRYRILGGGPERTRLMELAHSLKLNRVEFVGPVSPVTVQKELVEADAFVLGTRTAPDGDRDGIPNAILEAMAAGSPVVVSDAGGISEVIQHHETGWLVPANDPVSFAQALREVASDDLLRRRIIRNAHAAIWKRVSGNRNSTALALRLASEMSQV